MSGGASNSGGGDPGAGGTTGPGPNTETYAYVGSGTWGDAESGLVTVYKVDRTTRALTFVSEHAAGGLASYLAVDVQRQRLFVADEDDGGVLGFTIDPATGSLTPNGSAASENQPVHLSLTSDGAHLLAANYSQGNVDVYPISATGQPQASTQTESTGTNAHCIVIDSEARVFVANKGSGTISLFDFSTNILVPQNPASHAHPSARHITLGPEGRAYVVSEDHDTLTAYTVGDGGALSFVWEQARLPNAASGTGADVRVTPDGKYVYATNRDTSNTIVARHASDGQFIEHESTQGTIPRSLAMDPQGDFLIAANRGDKKLAIFDIEEDGALTHAQTETVSMTPFFVTIVDL